MIMTESEFAGIVVVVIVTIVMSFLIKWWFDM